MLRHLVIAMVIVLLALAISTSHAASPRADEIERSMLVTGSVDIKPDGSVAKHSLDVREQLPPGVAAFVDEVVGGWRFQPIVIDGHPTAAQSRMSIRLVARPVESSSFNISVLAVEFGDYDPETMPSYRSRRPPRYPPGALQSNVGGDVYTVVRIRRDGSVEDVVAEQTNLKTAVPANRRAQYEQMFAAASVAAIKRWSFNLPARAARVDSPFWVVRVPVSFRIMGIHRSARYGQWEAYLAGTFTPAPWRDAGDTARSADAIAAEGIYPLKSRGPRLLTPLQAG
jgi:hypothetical protein